jgi:DNA modification methylase
MIYLFHKNSLDLYPTWPSPTVIVSDGPYGVNGYDGDLKSAEGLAEWYEPHIEAWSKFSLPTTTLWFWNSELGFAEVHNVLKKYGWKYRACCVWNKGKSHIAGNANTLTLRKFPVTTEVCVHYVRETKFINKNTEATAQDWLRQEWSRTGLSFSKSNEACGVKNAATRKYLTKDHLWYFPPADVFERLAIYANEHGNPEGRPYFSLDGKNILLASQWEKMRGKFYCEFGITNVWDEPAVRGKERIKLINKSVHPNQKPLVLMERIIKASSDVEDVIWEPFAGLATASIAAHKLKRIAYAAEINKQIYEAAENRVSTL